MASYSPRDTTKPSFEVRRETFSGDVVRGPDGYRSVLRFGDTLLDSVIGGSLLLSRPEGYDGIKFWWGVPPEGLDDWVYMAVVRSGFGHPLTPSDGEVVLWKGSNTPSDSVPGTWVDKPLMPGRWYYYSLMFMTGNNRWTVVGKTSNVVPIDYKHRDHLWNSLPPFYQELDDDNWAGVGGRSHLRRFLGVVGYDLDLTRTLTEGLEYLYDPDMAPLALYEKLGVQNFGFENNTALGGGRMRSVIAASRDIMDRRGTLLGLSRYLEAATKYDCSASNGANLLMVGADADFKSGTGNWAPTPFAINDAIKEDSLGQDAGTPPNNLNTRFLTIKSLDVRDPNTYPEIPTLPLELTDSLSPVSNVARVDSNGGDMVICCGAGQKMKPIKVDEDGVLIEKYSHLTPMYRGIPVEENSVYHFSFYMAREVGNTENDRVEIGAALFDRDLDLPGFSDAFFSNPPDGLISYTSVVPSSVGISWHSAILDEYEWTRYVVTLESGVGARFMIPFIWVNSADWSNPSIGTHMIDTPRFITAAMVAKGQGVSIETVYIPGIHLVITANSFDEENVLGEDSGKVIGEPR